MIVEELEGVFMNRKVKSLILVGFCLSFLPLLMTSAWAYGDTGLKSGQKLIYEVSIVRTQEWTIRGRWENLTNPGIFHYTLFQESRRRTISGTITVDILEVRQYDVDLRVSYDLRDYEEFWDTYLNDTLPGDDYNGDINQTLYPNGPYVNTTLYTTLLWSNSDTFEMEVSKLTLVIEEITKYDAGVTLSNNFVATVNEHCSFWIYPDAKMGEPYRFRHIGMFLEKTGDYDNFGSSGDLTYEIEESRIYLPPAGGAGSTQPVWVVNYEVQPDNMGTSHAHTLDFGSYVNEFLFDKNTGILLQYRRVYRILPYDIIEFPGSPISDSNDLYNLEFTMTLMAGSRVWLKVSVLGAVLLGIFISIGTIIVIRKIYKRRRSNDSPLL